MSSIPNFQALVAATTEGAHALQEVFLFSLFPGTFPFKNEWKNALAGSADFRQVAMLGYFERSGQDVGMHFADRMPWLMGIDVQRSNLLYHKEALLGIAIGLFQVGTRTQKEWFRYIVLPKIAENEAKRGLQELLLEVVDGAPENFPSGTYLEYRLTSKLLTANEVSDPAAMKAYYLKARKFEFPAFSGTNNGRPDFFRSMLAVFVMDKCLELSVWEPERIAAHKQQAVLEALYPVEEKLRQRTSRQAGRLAGMATLLGIAVLAFCFWQLGTYVMATNARQESWATLKFSLYFIGGPISLLFYLFRMLFLIFNNGKTIGWDFVRAKKWLHKWLLRRRRQGLGLPET